MTAPTLDEGPSRRHADDREPTLEGLPLFATVDVGGVFGMTHSLALLEQLDDDRVGPSGLFFARARACNALCVYICLTVVADRRFVLWFFMR